MNAAAPLRREPHRGQPRAARLARPRCRSPTTAAGFAFAEEGKGLGLSGMRERALLVGGTLEIDSRPGKGTTVQLEVPAACRGAEDGSRAAEAA